MNCHLVAVEVSIECGTYQWVQLDGFAFYQLWLKCLDTEPVQGWCTVEQYRMFGNNFFQYIPNLWTGAFHHAFCRFDILCVVEVNQTFHHKRLEQFQCHLFWQTGLV